MNQSNDRLDLFSVRLRGTQAIEASAGTGKTWTITGLYIRLLLEENLEVSQILVVTYTKAATAELRTRIRGRLVEVAAALGGGEVTDEFCRRLVTGISDPKRARLLCERALRQLDEASVFTIHGFCQRALEDAAFESGSPFASEMIQDQSLWVRECVEDFWRRSVQNRDPAFLRYLLEERKYSPEKLTQEVRPWMGRPYFELLLPEAGEDSDDPYELELRTLRAELMAWLEKELPRRKAEHRQLYFDDLLLNLRQALVEGPRGNALAQRIRHRFRAALIDEFQDTDPIQYEIFSRVYGGREEPVFLVGDPKQAIYGFRGADIFAYLGAREAAAARHSLEENWRTDPALIRGVNTLFSATDDPFVFPEIEFHPASPAARPHPEVRLGGLEEKPLRIWFADREEGATKLLTAGEVERQVVDATADEIAQLLALGAAGEARIGEESVRGRNIAVLVQNHIQAELIRAALARRRVASVRKGSGSVFATREAADLERVLLAIADPTRERRIRAALATAYHGFDAAGIYAIAQTESEWDELQEHFRELRDQYSRDGVAAMLASWLEKNRVVARLLAGEDGDRALTNLFHLLELLRAEGRRQRQGMDRLLAWFADHRQQATEKEKGGQPADELVLRLESDENLVEISTIHACKGLEYDIVFCPFTYKVPARKLAEVFDFHDPEAGWQPTLDLGSRAREANGLQHVREELANRLRLLYVAMTRARHLCVCTWGAVKNGDESALGWLLLPHDGDGVSSDALDRPDGDFLSDLSNLERASDGSIAIDRLSERKTPEAIPQTRLSPGQTFVARHLSRSVRATRWTTSFSALTAGRAAERRDYDPLLPGERPAPTASGNDIFSFPRGATPGVCLHQIFETIDFREQDPLGWGAVVESALKDFDFSLEWREPILGMVSDVLQTALEPEGRVRLAEVSRAQRLDEVEFYYPAKTMTLSDLNALLQKHDQPGLGRSARDGDLPTPLTQGYVKGFIDLVFEAEGRFYLVDYKSNWLGGRLEDYTQDRLPAAMEEHLYTFQYLTYAIAVHRMLQQRIPDYDYDRHFGGVRYLFLRGIRPATGLQSGIFADKPARGLIEEFDELLGR
jgi:exodeoxyribonuclease V beta subunit